MEQVTQGGTITMNRVWAMPNKHTFLIKPIADLINRYVGDGKGWIDVFAGFHSRAEVRNDINPDTNAQYHLDAEYFCKNVLFGDWKGILFDPPYSLRQLKECYQNYGKNVSQYETRMFPQNVKEAACRCLGEGAMAISFGWNSQGFGKNMGFEILEILLVAHGRGHNDTIVVVEKRIKYINP